MVSSQRLRSERSILSSETLPSDATDMGPLITPSRRAAVEDHMARAEAEGAVRVVGGEHPGGGLVQGNCLTPLMYVNV